MKEEPKSQGGGGTGVWAGEGHWEWATAYDGEWEKIEAGQGHRGGEGEERGACLQGEKGGRRGSGKRKGERGGEGGEKTEGVQLRPSLAAPERGESVGVIRRVTLGLAQARVAREKELREEGSEDTTMPPMNPQEYLQWDTPETECTGLFTADCCTDTAGYGMANDPKVLMDPVARLLVRHDSFENRDAVWGKGGLCVRMDEKEAALLTGQNAMDGMRENVRTMQTAIALHLVHHYTHAASVDGSVTVVENKETGKKERKAGCGIYEGMQPKEALGHETPAQTADRRLGMGMWGVQLPSHVEVVDTEIMAILLYLRKIASVDSGSNREKRCLVMSDCSGARQLIEGAWRAGGVQHTTSKARGLMLEAICRYRRQLGMVTIMGIRSHRGGSASAYADAVAKAAAEQGQRRDHLIERLLVREAEGRKVVYEIVDTQSDTGWAVWDTSTFQAAKESAGAWARMREANRVKIGDRGVLIDKGKLGLRAVEGNGDYWEEIFIKTGRGVQVWGPDVQPEEAYEVIKGEAARLSVVMAMRGTAGELGWVAHGVNWRRQRDAEGEDEGWATRSERMGCPACCSRRRGWRWRPIGPEGEERWSTYTPNGKTPDIADTKHLACGRCVAADPEGGSHKKAIGEAMEGMIRSCKRKGAVVEGMGHAVREIRRAEEALAGARTTGEKEWESYRKVVAGVLPAPVGIQEGKWRARATKAMVHGIATIQREIAEMLTAYETESAAETAARKEEELAREWRRAALAIWYRAVGRIGSGEGSEGGGDEGGRGGGGGGDDGDGGDGGGGGAVGDGADGVNEGGNERDGGKSGDGKEREEGNGEDNGGSEGDDGDGTNGNGGQSGDGGPSAEAVVEDDGRSAFPIGGGWRTQQRKYRPCPILPYLGEGKGGSNDGTGNKGGMYGNKGDDANRQEGHGRDSRADAEADPALWNWTQDEEMEATQPDGPGGAGTAKEGGNSRDGRGGGAREDGAGGKRDGWMEEELNDMDWDAINSLAKEEIEGQRNKEAKRKRKRKEKDHEQRDKGQEKEKEKRRRTSGSTGPCKWKCSATWIMRARAVTECVLAHRARREEAQERRAERRAEKQRGQKRQSTPTPSQRRDAIRDAEAPYEQAPSEQNSAKKNESAGGGEGPSQRRGGSEGGDEDGTGPQRDAQGRWGGRLRRERPAAAAAATEADVAVRAERRQQAVDKRKARVAAALVQWHQEKRDRAWAGPEVLRAIDPDYLDQDGVGERRTRRKRPATHGARRDETRKRAKSRRT